jgi:Ras family protein A
MGAKYMECSSKEMNGVHEIFDTAIDITVRGQDVVEHPSSSSGRPGSSKTGSTAMPARKKKSKMCSIL